MDDVSGTNSVASTVKPVSQMGADIQNGIPASFAQTKGEALLSSIELEWMDDLEATR